MFDEGYIKFECNWQKSEAPDAELLTDLNTWRDKLYGLKLIGAYANGVGYGNISKRLNGNQFIITGSATGNLRKLSPAHFAVVTDFDLSKNSLICRGTVKASSESLSHGVLYRLDSAIDAVIHVHHSGLWKKLLFKVPTTEKGIPYGTPEMAAEIARLYQQTSLPMQKILVTAGHEEGIFTFGKDLDEAGKILLNYFEQ
jgi:ribulose-5-phosphate 4-epimerase/fuculose-1-phosphate aldolase